MRRVQLALLLVLLFSVLMLLSRSGGPAAVGSLQVSGAPGEGSCADCHFGGLNNGSAAILQAGGAGGYNPGQTYTMQVQIADPDAVRGGFQLSVRNALNQSAGTLTAGAGSQVLILGGRQYIEHNSSFVFFTGGLATWNFSWTAPLINQGPLTFYASTNAADFTGDESEDDVYNTILSLSTLAVRFGGIKAEAAGLDVRLEWQTLYEDGAGFFEVERSLDGQNFLRVGQLATSGHSGSPRLYRHNEAAPVFNQPLYYRIRETDAFGTVQHSETVSVRVDQNHPALTRVFPNPVFGGSLVNVELALPQPIPVELWLRDMKGMQVHYERHNLLAGWQRIGLPIEKLPAGVYTLTLKMGAQYQSRKLVLTAMP